MGNTFCSIFVTVCDAEIRPNKYNSYANVFPIDDIQTRKNDNGSVCVCFATGKMKT